MHTHSLHAGADGREQSAGNIAGEDERGIGGRLFQQLEQGVGGLRVSQLRHQRLRLPDEEHLDRPHRRRLVGESAHGPHRGDVDTGSALFLLMVQPVRSPFLQ